MSAQHTLAVEDIGNGDFVILDENSNSVARVYDRALAHQFAAAPDLRAALNDAYDWITELLPASSNGGPRLDALRAAIAKAEGRAEA